MAIKLPDFKFFSKTDAKSRVFFLLAALVGIVVVIFFVARYLSSGENAAGPSRVATAPSNLQSVPGGQLSPEYYRALMQANEQSAQQALSTGGTAVPTLVNIPNQSSSNFPSQNCTVVCPGPDDANVANDLNELVKSGKLLQKDADRLAALAKANVSVDEYAAALDELVRQGKLTPEQARQLLAKYKKQHQNALLADSGRLMDTLIKSGQLPLDVANRLLALQKSNATPADYAEELNRLVAEGKISPQTAAQLLAQYTQQKANEATKQGIFAVKQLAKSGAITQEVADQLGGMQLKNVPVDQYAAALQRLVSEGKMTPAVAAKLLADYKARRAAFGGAMGALEALIQQQAIECQNDMRKLGQANPKNIPPSCQKLNALKAAADRLMKLQANNASPAAYADELKRLVQAGLLSPEAAATLMQYYEATAVPAAGSAPAVSTVLPTTSDFARLQQVVSAQPAEVATAQNVQAEAQFAAAESQATQAAIQERQQRVQQIQAAMSGQAQALIASWQPVRMAHQAGQPPAPAKGSGLSGGKGGEEGGAAEGSGSATEGGRPLIKAGTIYFAVLDTAVDSDYPDTPVMVTIVQGPFKGAKLLGKLSLAQGKDRVSLNFNLIDMEAWPKTKNTNAFAIDPDTARTVMASSVDHHYLMRYGSLFASSFMQGYAQGVQNAGTSTTGIFGTSTQNPKLSFGNNIAVGLGQVGTAFTNVVQGYVNTPATVKVNAGVGLGILFMSDVT
ncbi:MAG TPA: TrbI/VirB10 family protein [Gammaproteobacteria bacterium]|nr:TrbI/VirB10 family protein [Gammaproteobacteria bacterium]